MQQDSTFSKSIIKIQIESEIDGLASQKKTVDQAGAIVLGLYKNFPDNHVDIDEIINELLIDSKDEEEKITAFQNILKNILNGLIEIKIGKINKGELDSNTFVKFFTALYFYLDKVSIDDVVSKILKDRTNRPNVEGFLQEAEVLRNAWLKTYQMVLFYYIRDVDIDQTNFSYYYKELNKLTQYFFHQIFMLRDSNTIPARTILIGNINSIIKKLIENNFFDKAAILVHILENIKEYTIVNSVNSDVFLKDAAGGQSIYEVTSKALENSNVKSNYDTYSLLLSSSQKVETTSTSSTSSSSSTTSAPPPIDNSNNNSNETTLLLPKSTSTKSTDIRRFADTGSKGFWGTVQGTLSSLFSLSSNSEQKSVDDLLEEFFSNEAAEGRQNFQTYITEIEQLINNYESGDNSPNGKEFLEQIEIQTSKLLKAATSIEFGADQNDAAISVHTFTMWVKGMVDLLCKNYVEDKPGNRKNKAYQLIQDYLSVLKSVDASNYQEIFKNRKKNLSNNDEEDKQNNQYYELKTFEGIIFSLQESVIDPKKFDDEIKKEIRKQEEFLTFEEKIEIIRTTRLEGLTDKKKREIYNNAIDDVLGKITELKRQDPNNVALLVVASCNLNIKKGLFQVVNGTITSSAFEKLIKDQIATLRGINGANLLNLFNCAIGEPLRVFAEEPHLLGPTADALETVKNAISEIAEEEQGEIQEALNGLVAKFKTAINAKRSGVAEPVTDENAREEYKGLKEMVERANAKANEVKSNLNFAFRDHSNGPLTDSELPVPSETLVVCALPFKDFDVTTGQDSEEEGLHIFSEARGCIVSKNLTLFNNLEVFQLDKKPINHVVFMLTPFNSAQNNSPSGLLPYDEEIKLLFGRNTEFEPAEVRDGQSTMDYQNFVKLPKDTPLPQTVVIKGKLIKSDSNSAQRLLARDESSMLETEETVAFVVFPTNVPLRNHLQAIWERAARGEDDTPRQTTDEPIVALAGMVRDFIKSVLINQEQFLLTIISNEKNGIGNIVHMGAYGNIVQKYSTRFIKNDLLASIRRRLNFSTLESFLNGAAILGAGSIIYFYGKDAADILNTSLYPNIPGTYPTASFLNSIQNSGDLAIMNSASILHKGFAESALPAGILGGLSVLAIIGGKLFLLKEGVLSKGEEFLDGVRALALPVTVVGTTLWASFNLQASLSWKMLQTLAANGANSTVTLLQEGLFGGEVLLSGPNANCTIQANNPDSNISVTIVQIIFNSIKRQLITDLDGLNDPFLIMFAIMGGIYLLFHALRLIQGVRNVPNISRPRSSLGEIDKAVSRSTETIFSERPSSLSEEGSIINTNFENDTEDKEDEDKPLINKNRRQQSIEMNSMHGRGSNDGEDDEEKVLVSDLRTITTSNSSSFFPSTQSSPQVSSQNVNRCIIS